MNMPSIDQALESVFIAKYQETTYKKPLSSRTTRKKCICTGRLVIPFSIAYTQFYMSWLKTNMYVFNTSWLIQTI